MLRKREVVTTTNSRGWYYIQQIAEDTIRLMERDAIDEEDDTKGSLLRRQAKAAREFYTRFSQQIEAMRRIDVPTDDEEPEGKGEDFYDMAMD